MSAYRVAQTRIGDPDEHQKCLTGFPPGFERHGGVVLATSRSETVVMAGQRSHPRTVIMRFPGMEAPRSWHSDPDVELSAHRRRAAKISLVLVEGVD
jgi:uncharacterized protein (DUF1330 family)